MNESIYDENGNVRIPCKPGAYVYQLDRFNKKIITKKVRSVNCYISQEHFSIQVEFETAGFVFSREFGRSVFLNKNEARQALKEDKQ